MTTYTDLVNGFINRKMEMNLVDDGATEGVHYRASALDNRRTGQVIVTKAEKELAVYMATLLIKTVGDPERALLNTSKWREIVESQLHIGYFEEVSIEYDFGQHKERVRNVVVGKQATNFVFEVYRTRGEVPIDDTILSKVMVIMRIETIHAIGRLMNR